MSAIFKALQIYITSVFYKRMTQDVHVFFDPVGKQQPLTGWSVTIFFSFALFNFI